MISRSKNYRKFNDEKKFKNWNINHKMQSLAIQNQFYYMEMKFK